MPVGTEEWRFPLRNTRNVFHVTGLAPKEEERKCTLIGLNKESSLTGLEGNCLEVHTEMQTDPLRRFTPL